MSGGGSSGEEKTHDRRLMEEAINAMADGDTRWRMCQSFLLRNGITSPQQRGYEHFMSTLLPEIIQENSSIHTVCEERKRRDEFWFAGVTVPVSYTHLTLPTILRV